MADFRDQLYQKYGEFKGWTSEAQLTNMDELFAIEIAKTGIQAGSRILEVGFGSGQFLDWAKKNGYKTFGIELSDDFVEMAKKQGHQAFLLKLQDLEKISDQLAQVDLIVIFDVLEHLYPEELMNLFKSLDLHLKEGAKVLARSPNAQSPFGLQLQFADLTHVTPLTPLRIEQLCIGTSLRLASWGNAARPLSIGKRPLWQRKLLFKLRDLVEIVVGLLYFGKKTPLDPNMLVVLEKQKHK